MSNQNSFAFYSLWEELNNPDFNAIGIIPSSGRYSKGTYAHPDIAFEFASWLFPEFKLYLITEFQRLKLN